MIFFTTGLSDPYDPTALTGWNTLTKIDGGANKTGEAGGSFGIGKNAPFANSYYRLVFYRTLNQKGEQAAQGIARLASFKVDDENVSTGVGYFGNPVRNQPVESIPELDELWKRPHKKDFVGTDVFIFGFNGKDAWKDDVYVELIENFLMSIFWDKLAVKVENENEEREFLEQKTLGKFVERYKDNLKNANSYYKVLTAKEVEQYKFEEDFHGLGTLKLSVVVNDEENLNRRVLVVRKSGMKIFDMDRISRSISFSGILELEGYRLNEFFRQMETPAHDKWEPNRHTDDTKAKKYLKELKDWVREKIKSLGRQETTDETEVQGLSSMLQFNSNPADIEINEKVETLNPESSSEIFEIESTESIIKKALSEKNDGSDDSEFQKVNGTISKDGENFAIRNLKGLRPRRKKDVHKGTENPDGTDTILKPSGNFVDCRNRIVKLSDNSYRLILEVPKNISSGTIKIFAIGEEDEGGEELKILSATAKSNCGSVETFYRKIKFKNIRYGGKVKIDFSLNDNEEYSYSMRAEIYENKF